MLYHPLDPLQSQQLYTNRISRDVFLHNFQWIRFRENLNRKPSMFPWYMGFSCTCSTSIHWNFRVSQFFYDCGLGCPPSTDPARVRHSRLFGTAQAGPGTAGEERVEERPGFRGLGKAPGRTLNSWGKLWTAKTIRGGKPGNPQKKQCF